MNDIDRHDEHDKQLDRNLLAAARHLELPAEPSPLQQARWKQTASPSSKGRKKGILGMKRENFWRVLGAGGALAACVTIMVVLGLGGTNKVEAAVIFDSLRDAIRRSLWIDIDDVSADGITANGRLLLVFAENAENVPESNTTGIAASYIDVRMTAADDHATMPGLDLEAAIAIAPLNQWGYVKTHHIPQPLFVETPMLGLFAPALNSGILIDLESIDAANAGHLMMSAHGHAPVAKITFSTGTGSASSAPADEDEQTETLLEFSVSTSEAPDDANASEDLTVDHVNEHLHGMMLGSDFQTSADSPEAAAAMELHMVMVRDFLTGRFTAEQMNQFIDMIESSASETIVAQNPDGSFLLTASGFDFGQHANADSDIVMEVTYWENSGIDNVRLLNFGEGTGTLRMTFSDSDITADVFDRTRFESRDGTRTVSQLSDLFGLAH